MKVLLIGLGHVGKALWEIEHDKYDVWVYDINPDSIQGIPQSSNKLESTPTDCDIIQICIGVKTGPQGEIMLSNYINTVLTLEDLISPNALVIIESTVPVGTTREIWKKLGISDKYECGLLYRIKCWLKFAGVECKITPEFETCLMPEKGECCIKLKLIF